MTVPDSAPVDPVEALADRHLVERGRRYLRKIRLRLLRRELECGSLRRREEELRQRLFDAEEAARKGAPELEALRAEVASLRGQLDAARALVERAERERDEARAAAQERTAAAARAEEEARAVREVLEASRRESAEGRAALDGLQRAAAAVAAERDGARAELDRVYSSRLWRVGTAYWRLLRSLGLLRGAAPAPAARTEVQTPAVAPGPAPEAGLPVSAPLTAETAPEEVAPQPVPAEPPSASSEAAPEPPAAAEAAEQVLFADAVPSAYDVVCFSIIEWGFRFQRPQQLLGQFAGHGHRVFYVSQVFRPDGPPYVLTPIRPNVVEVSLRGPSKNIYRDTLDPAELDALFESLDALRRDLGLGATVSLVELPFWWPLAERARERRSWPVVYDCMDYHPGFSTNDTAMLETENALISGADLVVVSSAFLEREVGHHARRLLRVPNACDYDAFAAVPPPPRGPSPVVGYYGAIADWFDADLVADLAERRPDWKFLLVGSTFTADLSRLSKLPNVELPGEVPYADLPGWIARMDVLLIPFRRTELTEATNPVKAYEILAAGRPLVSVPLPEVVALGDLVRLAGTAAEMEREVLAALRTDGEAARERRRAFAREQTWSHRFETLSPEVEASFPRVSVVVVTYNNREWNERCLVSLRERNEWPNLEVVVVDNASQDGSPELLRQQAALDPRIRLVLNDDNRGFAAANNQGLALSTGRVLVLLNNDTVATRGFLASFTRHLLADPTIGLLGASTNEIANEARVDEVGYDDLEELHPWAADFVREHDGQLEDLSMLAMFCIAWTRETFERIGELDERFVVGMFEDDDYAKRAHELGLRTVVARDAFVHHAGRASFKSIGDARYFEIFETNRARFQEKWGLWLPHVTKHARSMVGPFRKELAWRMEQAGADPGRVVVFLPAVGWNISLVQRPHHLARAFARRGWFVLFDCTNSAAEDFGGFQEVEPRLLLFRGPTDILTDLPEPPVLWTLPYNASLVDSWKRRRVVYDCIDDLKVFPYNQKLLERAHDRMLREADAVLCVSRPLLEDVRKRRPDALYVPNAVDVDHFAALPEDAPRPEALKRVLEDGRPVVGYYGAIASWLDVDMVESAARLRPDWSFVLLGQRLLDAPPLDRLEALPNVFVLPPQRYEAIPSVLACFDVAFIPFAVNDITHATSPLKLFEYFAGGKPVLSSPMPECAAFPEVRIVASGRQLAEALDPALLDSWDAAHRARLRRLASENSWAARADGVIAALHVEAAAAPEPAQRPAPAGDGWRGRFRHQGHHVAGRCNVCGEETQFTFEDPKTFRESLVCGSCGTTSRYRSIARGVLRAIERVAGVKSESLAGLPRENGGRRFRVFDTQLPFTAEVCAYPIPDLLAACPWIDVELGVYRPRDPLGTAYAPRTTNQDLERLTFADASFELVVTSDVMEHVRRDDVAHREIHRVLSDGGAYVFTVPHLRSMAQTLVRRRVVDPDDPSRDEDLLPPEYHGDANDPDGGVLAYRAYGTDLDAFLKSVGFRVEYSCDELSELGIRSTELYYCTKVRKAPPATTPAPRHGGKGRPGRGRR